MNILSKSGANMAELPSRKVTHNATAIESEQQRAIAEVQCAMMVAQSRPRDENASICKILQSCSRQTLANSALYTYAKGGRDISGASIRLAEAIATAWGNISFGVRELSRSSTDSVVQAFAWDMETNTRREMTFHVSHSIYTAKSGVKLLTDPREIYEQIANQAARRLRSCILSIIPGDVIDEAISQCEQTMRDQADPTQDLIDKLLDCFDKIGVTKEQIETKIQRNIAAIKANHMIQLRQIYSSIKDGVSEPSDFFK